MINNTDQPLLFYTCWIETKSRATSDTWQLCEYINEDTYPPGVLHLDDGMFESCHDLAEHILSDHIEAVLAAHSEEPDVEVRVWVQLDDEYSSAPLVRQATSDEMDDARERVRLDAVSCGLVSARVAVSSAWEKLHEAVVKAHDEGLDVERITTSVRPKLGRESVAALIEAHDVARTARTIIATQPDLFMRAFTAVKDHRRTEVQLHWSEQEEESDHQREIGWNESIEDYDEDLAVTLLTDARKTAARIIELLTPHLDVQDHRGLPATPEYIAPKALTYHPIVVKRPTQPHSSSA